MSLQKLALNPGEAPRLELEWGTYMRDFEIRLDGKEIGRIDGGQRVLKEPHNFTLPDGSELTIQLNQNQLVDELEVLRDGVPLPGSASNPIVKLSAAIRSGFYFGILTTLVGLLAQFSNSVWPIKLTFSPWSILFGLMLIACTVGLASRSRIAAILAVVVLLADWGVAVAVSRTMGISYNFLSSAAILARIFALVALVRAVLTLYRK